jgi:hypothetical protein
MLVYYVSRPGKDGEASDVSKWLAKVSNMKERWETQNHNNTALIEQAAQDKHLFYHVGRNRHIELSYPE